jgi:hypothetical protein
LKNSNLMRHIFFLVCLSLINTKFHCRLLITHCVRTFKLEYGRRSNYRFGLGLLVFFFLKNLHAQNWTNPLKPFDSKVEFIYGIDNRRTHIYQHNTLIYGLYTGISLEDKLRFKVGISGTPFERGRFIDEDGLLTRNRLVFLNLGEEFDYFIKDRFRLTSYVQGGLGYNYYRKLNGAKEVTETGRNTIIPLEIGTHANYDLNSWARLKLGGGWRFVFPEVSNSLSGYYIKLGVGIHGGRLLSWHQNKKPLFDLKNNL